MTRFIIVSILLLIIKLLIDSSKFRWFRAWWSDIKFLTWWRSVKSPFDMWHTLYGSIYTYIAYDHLKDAGYAGLELYLYTAIWWAIFFGSFSLIYHYLGMKKEYWGT